SHEPYGQARLVFIGNSRLVQPDNALGLLPRAHREDGGAALLGHRNLVARQNRYAAPGRYRVATVVDALRIQAPAAALPADGGDGLRVGEDDAGVLPDGGQQLV